LLLPPDLRDWVPADHLAHFVIGIIKSVLGFRQFLLRGTAKVSTEWTLLCLAYNFKRLHRLGAGQELALAQ
jgi:hypothetical protein